MFILYSVLFLTLNKEHEITLCNFSVICKIAVRLLNNYYKGTTTAYSDHSCQAKYGTPK